MKLSTWARQQRLAYQTAMRLWRTDWLPLPATQLLTGTTLVHLPESAAGTGAALYARVSSHDQKADLERQLGRLAVYAAHERLLVTHAVAEAGSGLNGHRTKLLRLLADPQVAAIVVEQRDRPARFGGEYVEAALAAAGRRVIVVETGELPDDLVRDLIEVLTSFCARLYGWRSARRRAEQAVAAAREGLPC